MNESLVINHALYRNGRFWRNYTVDTVLLTKPNYTDLTWHFNYFAHGVDLNKVRDCLNYNERTLSVD